MSMLLISSKLTVKTPVLDVSFGAPDAVISSVSSGFIHLANTISHISKLQLVPRIKSYKLWYHAKVLLFPIPLKKNVSFLINSLFFVIQQHLGSSLLHHEITSL